MSEYDKELQSNTDEFDEARAPLERETRRKREHDAQTDGGADDTGTRPEPAQ